MRLSVILSFLILSCPALAQVALPQDAPTVDTLVSGFRDDIKAKIQQLVPNYTNPTLTDTYAVFNSPQGMTCNDGTIIPPNGQVFRIDRSANLRPVGEAQELVETISYTACSGKKAFSEIIIKDGTALVQDGWAQILNGAISYSIQPNETRKSGRLMNGSGGEIAAAYTTRTGAQISTSITFGSQPALDVVENDGNDTSSIFYTRHDYNVNLTIDFNQISTSFTGKNTEYSIIAYSNGTILYREINHIPKTKLLWSQDFSNHIIGGTISGVQNVVDAYIVELAPTVLVSTAADNARLLSELNQAITELNSNNLTQINQVKLLLQSYVTDINNGQLDVTDNRPKN